MSFWSQRAKRLWHEKGDKCTILFYRVVNTRQAKKSAQGVLINGQIEQDVWKYHDHLIAFYKQLYEET